MSNVTKEHCLEIIGQFEPCPENRQQGALGIDGKLPLALTHTPHHLDVVIHTTQIETVLCASGLQPDQFWSRVPTVKPSGT